MARLPRPAEIIGVLNLPVGRQDFLNDTHPDPGLFGPGSVTWRILSEPLLVLGGVRGVLMQIAHPLIAEGVLVHSNFEADPFGRLLRTFDWTVRVAFGTTREAAEACREINRVHRQVRGMVSEATATETVPAGTEYSARARDLVRWVHATLIDTILVTYLAFGGVVSPEDQDRYVREWNAVGRLMGLREADFFHSRAELSAYIRRELDTSAEVGPGSLHVSRSLLRGPFAVTRPVWPAVTLISLGLTDPVLRRRLGVRWSRGREQLFRATLSAQRGIRSFTPEAARLSTIRRFAERRCRGELAPGLSA